jgi:hypothetical protein
LPLHQGAEVLRAVDPKIASGALGAAHPELRSRLIGELDADDAQVVSTDARQAHPETRASPIRRLFGRVLAVRRRAPS